MVVRDWDEEHATRENIDTVPDWVTLVGVGVTAVGHWSAWAITSVANDGFSDDIEDEDEDEEVVKSSVVAEVIVPEAVEILSKREEEVEPSIFVSEVP